MTPIKDALKFLLDEENSTEIKILSIAPEATFEKNFFSREDAAKEKHFYNGYLLAALIEYFNQYKEHDTAAMFKACVDDAVERAIKMTHERLYGSLKWMDQKTFSGSKSPTMAKTPRSGEMSEATVVSGEKAVKRNRVKEIYARVVQLHNSGSDREAVIAAITSEYGISTRITAVTYRNGALQEAGLSPRKAKEAVVVAPIVEASAVEVQATA